MRNEWTSGAIGILSVVEGVRHTLIHTIDSRGGQGSAIPKASHDQRSRPLHGATLQTKPAGQLLFALLKATHILFELPKHQIAAETVFLRCGVWVHNQYEIQRGTRIPPLDAALPAFRLEIVFEEEGLAASIDIAKVFDALTPVVAQHPAPLDRQDGGDRLGSVDQPSRLAQEEVLIVIS